MLESLKKLDQRTAYLDKYLPQRKISTSRTKAADKLERQGWRAWLTTIFPFACEEDFSEDHVKFWDLRWSVLLRIRAQMAYKAVGLPHPAKFDISEEEYNTLLILGRGLGKSATIEMSAVMRGAILDGGYCLYICEGQDQAEEHIGNCRDLIENPDSRLSEFYPGMAATERKHRSPRKQKWSSDLFVTANGWICRAKGLNSKLRGLRIGTRRPDDIKVDDIDGVNDSIALALKKLKQLTASVFPTQARQFTTIDFGQNLITEHSVMNQICTGKSDALGARTTIGVSKTFARLDMEAFINAEGRTLFRILPTSIPTWAGVNIKEAQKFLYTSGKETFLAEYQNEFEHMREGKVLRNWDDARMVISKSDFERIFRSREIPTHWYKYVGHDWSRTKNEYHACVAGKLTVAGQSSPLPGKMFMFDAMSFDANTQCDDVALRILNSISPTVPGTHRTWKEIVASHYSRAGLEKYLSDSTKLIKAQRDTLSRVLPSIVSPLLKQKNYVKFRGSNEQNNDGLAVYRQSFGLPFQPSNPKSDGGFEWIDHFMQVDHTSPHPFFEDELLEDGKYKLGCPGFFLIVEDDKTEYPKELKPDNLHDSDLCRYQFHHWLMRAAVLNDAGYFEYGPVKMNDDFGQMLQMLMHDNCVQAAPLTHGEKVDALLTAEVQPAVVAAATDPRERASLMQAQLIQRQRIETKIQRERPKRGGSGFNALRQLDPNRRKN